MSLPIQETRCRLLPISENRAFCYWHIGRSAWEALSQEFGELGNRVACFLQIAFRRGDTLVPVPELTRPVDPGSTSDFYLDLAPDLIYQARLIARIEGERRELTDWSNPCQLARTHPGRAPLLHKRENQPGNHPTVRPLRNPTGTSQYSWGYLMLHLHAHLPYIADPINFGEGSGTA